jgi:tetratricopeptide (TPR) repeat protein
VKSFTPETLLLWARHQCRSESATTALIHEAYLRMVNQKEKHFENRAHFFGVAAQAMRHILVAAQFWPQYLRGQAYLKLARGAEAAAEFQKILDHRGQGQLSSRFVPTCPVLYPLAHLGLARAAAMSGDATKARQAYQDFFALWKDADADMPALIEAKKEYEKLK